MSALRKIEDYTFSLEGIFAQCTVFEEQVEALRLNQAKQLEFLKLSKTVQATAAEVTALHEHSQGNKDVHIAYLHFQQASAPLMAILSRLQEKMGKLYLACATTAGGGGSENDVLDKASKKVAMVGWLRKKGEGALSNSHRRYFAVDAMNPTQLKYYENETSSKAKGCIALDQMEAVRMNEQDKTEFSIVTPGRTWKLQADTPHQAKIWIKLLTKWGDAYHKQIKKQSLIIENQTNVGVGVPFKSPRSESNGGISGGIGAVPSSPARQTIGSYSQVSNLLSSSLHDSPSDPLCPTQIAKSKKKSQTGKYSTHGAGVAGEGGSMNGGGGFGETGTNGTTGTGTGSITNTNTIIAPSSRHSISSDHSPSSSSSFHDPTHYPDSNTEESLLAMRAEAEQREMARRLEQQKRFREKEELKRDRQIAEKRAREQQQQQQQTTFLSNNSEEYHASNSKKQSSFQSATAQDVGMYNMTSSEGSGSGGVGGGSNRGLDSIHHSIFPASLDNRTTSPSSWKGQMSSANGEEKARDYHDKGRFRSSSTSVARMMSGNGGSSSSSSSTTLSSTTTMELPEAMNAQSMNHQQIMSASQQTMSASQQIMSVAQQSRRVPAGPQVDYVIIREQLRLALKQKKEQEGIVEDLEKQKGIFDALKKEKMEKMEAMEESDSSLVVSRSALSDLRTSALHLKTSVSTYQQQLIEQDNLVKLMGSSREVAESKRQESAKELRALESESRAIDASFASLSHSLAGLVLSRSLANRGLDNQEVLQNRLEMLVEAGRAHEDQNRLLLADMERLLHLSSQASQQRVAFADDLQQQLDLIRARFQYLRTLTNTDHQISLPDEIRALLHDYFVSISNGIKLHLIQESYLLKVKSPTELFDIAMEQRVEMKQWPNWISSYIHTHCIQSAPPHFSSPHPPQQPPVQNIADIAIQQPVPRRRRRQIGFGTSIGANFAGGSLMMI